jgi:hypothetical protein
MLGPVHDLEFLTKKASDSVDLSTLTKAQQQAREGLEELTEAYADLDLRDDIGIAVIGSLGRYERTQGSDLDIVLLTELSEYDDRVRDIDRQIAERAVERGFELSNPKGHPKFSIYSPSMLSHVIGEDPDRNTLMTVRMCLLLESVGVGGADCVRAAKERLMDAYLAKNSLRDCVPPRFLLNEVVRFWRTMAVDFEGKMRRREDRGWVLRNGKLRTVRKMLYASGLLPVLECARLQADEMKPFLTERLRLRPTNRVAEAFMAYGMPDDGARALRAYCDFLEILDSATDRQALEEMDKEDREESELWHRVRQSGLAFHRSLTALLFDSDLGATTREYAVL